MPAANFTQGCVFNQNDYQVDSSNDTFTQLKIAEGQTSITLSIHKDVILQLAADLAKPVIEKEMKKEMAQSGIKGDGPMVFKIFKVFNIPVSKVS